MTDERIDIEKLTVEELAATLLDRLRVDVENAKLDDDLEPDGLKFLSAVRKMAHQDPQALADGFVALSLDSAAQEEKIQFLMSLLEKTFKPGGEDESAPEALN